jgi:hypothetical protein
MESPSSTTTPTNVLHKLADEGDWDAVRNFLTTGDISASHTVICDFTLLHYAMLRAHLPTILLCLDMHVHPLAGRVPALVLALDTDQNGCFDSSHQPALEFASFVVHAFRAARDVCDGYLSVCPSLAAATAKAVIRVQHDATAVQTLLAGGVVDDTVAMKVLASPSSAAAVRDLLRDTLRWSEGRRVWVTAVYRGGCERRRRTPIDAFPHSSSHPLRHQPKRKRVARSYVAT